jgi:hypothetical protein
MDSKSQFTEGQQSVGLYQIFCRHCEERGDVAIHLTGFTHGLLLPTSRDRNDEDLESILGI